MSRELLGRLRQGLYNGEHPAKLIEAIDEALRVGGEYETGHYLLITFDRYGTRLDSRMLGPSGLIEGQAQGRAAVAAGECESAAVTRVVWNSRDDAWGNR